MVRWDRWRWIQIEVVPQLWVQLISIKSEKENEEIIKTFPPDPLHKDILGPGNDCLEKMEYHWGDAMTLLVLISNSSWNIFTFKSFPIFSLLKLKHSLIIWES